MHFGLKNLNELPSLEEFEELAQAAMGGPPPETPVAPPPDGTETAEREFLSSSSGTIEQPESLENPSSDEAAGAGLSDIVPDSSEPQRQEHTHTTPAEAGSTGFSSSQRS
jgi:segregation and condensation protein B